MPNKKKTNRGRPKKIFVAKPSKAKKSGPGRPKKEHKNYDLPSIGKKKGFFSFNLLHAPKKDAIILLLFVFSLLLFLFALYITILKGQTHLASQLAEDKANSIINVETGNIPYQQTNSGSLVSTGIHTPIHSENLTTVITDFYAALNQKDTATMSKLADKPLRSSDVFITYFTKNRITIFVNGLEGPLQVRDLQIVPRTATSTAAEKITYTLRYTLKDGHIYQEDRSVVLVKRGEEYKIGKIMCDTVKCSQMPFFNPEKYGIK